MTGAQLFWANNIRECSKIVVFKEGAKATTTTNKC